MLAFLPTPRAPALNVPGARAARVCSRRPTPSRQPARVHFSATIDEAPPIDGPPAPPPRRRPEPSAPPPRRSPSAYSPRPDRPRPSADRRFPRDDRGPPRPPFVVDPTATYYTKCSSCQAAYEIKPEVLGARGKKVGCAVCGHVWFQKSDRLITLKEGEKFKTYPTEEKDRLMEEQAQSRRDRYRDRGRTGDRRDGAREGQGARRGAPRTAYAQHSVFIGNLPFSVTKDELEQMIAETVEVTRVAIVKDPAGRSKGFAFADLKSAEDVQTAVNQLDGRDLGGRTMTVRVGRKN